MLRILKYILLSFYFTITALHADDFIFRIVDLGTLQADSSKGFAINNVNQVVGKYTLENTNYFFIWENEEIELIDLPSTSQPKAINSACQICAQYTNDTEHTRGLFYEKGVGFIDLGTLGGDNTWVEDMNESGQIVGYSETGNFSSIRPEQKEIHAFVWSNGEMRDLGVLKGDIGQGGDESKAFGINDHGDIIGMLNYALVYKGKTFASVEKACIWKHGMLKEIYPSSHPAALSHAFDINNKNEIIVGVQESLDNYILYYLNLDTGIKSAISYCNLPYVTLKKINNNGVLVGSPYVSSAYYSNVNGVQWDSHYRQIQLSPDFSWKCITQIFQINDNNIVVGTAENIYGEEHAVILLPEVSSRAY